MTNLFRIIAVLILPVAMHAHAQPQEDDGVAAQRARIAAGRRDTEAAFRAQEKACYGKFALNDCLAAAKAHRREVLADLRRQEVSLNDAQRKQRAAEHLRNLEERAAPERQQSEAERRSKSLAEQRERDAGAAQKAAQRASSEASAPARSAERQQEVERKKAENSAARKQRAEEAAQNVKDRQQRLAEAQERKAGRERRLAERNKPAAKPLPAATE
jgi:colicin import membrane protein